MSFLWHDYETFGIHPGLDRPAQFAAIRTDESLQETDKPVTWFCKPANDFLPHPFACLVTGISPQQARDQGVVEADFARKVHHEMMEPNTCTAGYNSVRFDDEFSRNLFYRNFFDPYEREYMNGNSRWDLIDLTRMFYALRPGGVQWPEHEPGKPSFKLEDLTAANEIEHSGAHDALVDVRATIALARLLKKAQPRLFDWGLGMRDQKYLQGLLNPANSNVLLHTASRIPAQRGCTTLILPLAQEAERKKSIIVYDLMTDPGPMVELSAEEIKRRVFTSASKLPKGTERIPLSSVAINKVPMVAPASVLKEVDCERIKLDPDRCKHHAEILRQHLPDIRIKLLQVFSRDPMPASGDPDDMIYSGGFFSRRDKTTMTKIRATDPSTLAGEAWNFDDTRLAEMLFRYRARNYPDTLNATETAQWEEQRIQRLNEPGNSNRFVLEDFHKELQESREKARNNVAQESVLDDVESWVQTLFDRKIK